MRRRNKEDDINDNGISSSNKEKIKKEEKKDPVCRPYSLEAQKQVTLINFALGIISHLSYSVFNAVSAIYITDQFFCKKFNSLTLCICIAFNFSLVYDNIRIPIGVFVGDNNFLRYFSLNYPHPF